MGELKQLIYPHLDTGTFEQYESFRNAYHDLLQQYETAAANDFEADYMRAQLAMPENYQFTRITRAYMRGVIWLMYALSFAQYAIVLFFYLVLIYWLAFGWNVPAC
jgi:hypothetical protein